ncbi:MAG TPA: efflux transporter outer membrane subunit, partial [Thermoanaerobaculia bacterium]
GGAASALETSNAEAALATEAAQVPLLESQIVAKENQIDLLLGRGPGPVARGASLAEQAIRPEVPAGLPSALLERRPDLRQAEQQLIGATYTVSAAHAAFFPTISLTGLFGGVSPELSDLLRDNKTWSVGGGILGPIFQGGRLRSQLRVAQAQAEQAKLAYEQAVTTSLGEVSSALVALQKLADAQKERDRAVAADREAVRLSLLRYNSGLSAYVEVITAQQQLLGAENALAETRRDRLVALVQLYKALGGGWQTAEDPGATPAAQAAAPAGSPR